MAKKDIEFDRGSINSLNILLFDGRHVLPRMARSAVARTCWKFIRIRRLESQRHESSPDFEREWKCKRGRDSEGAGRRRAILFMPLEMADDATSENGEREIEREEEEEVTKKKKGARRMRMRMGGGKFVKMKKRRVGEKGKSSSS